MLLYVLFIATFNLALGYALGAGMISLNELPSCSLGGILGVFKRTKTDTQDSEESSQDEVVVDDPLEDILDELDEEPPSQADLIAGLSSFREKLTNVSLELKLSQEDPDRFEDCATKLQSVNHDYIEHTSEVIDSLEETATEESESCESLKKNAAEVKELSGKIDKLLEKPMDAEAKQELINTSETIRDNAATVEQHATQAAAENPEQEESQVDSSIEDQVTELENATPAQAEKDSGESAPLEKLLDAVEWALSSANRDEPMIMAEFRLDPLTNGASGTVAHTQALLGLTELEKALLDSEQPFTEVDRRVVFLRGEDFAGAWARISKIQQTLSELPFGDEENPTHVTCSTALVEVRPGESRDTWLERLTECLDRAAEKGPNNAFHHDGAIPLMITPEHMVTAVEA